jgi:toxin ParE1/3/4
VKVHDVRYSRLAARQLIDIERYIEKAAGGLIARGYVGRIENLCRGLREFPERGTKRDDIRRGLRTVGFERSATIAFVVDEHAVTIIQILYGGRNVEARLRGKSM